MIIGFLLGILSTLVAYPFIMNVFNYFDNSEPEDDEDEYEDIL